MRTLIVALLCIASLIGCTGTPENITPVKGFELEKYLGKWYEVARLPHPFEEGLSRVTAMYTLRDDDGINVVNRGYSEDEKEWDIANGKAYFVDSPDIGYLKVSFFGPFYASYVVIELDENYQYAMVTGPDRDYLWILSRTPELPDSTLERLVKKASDLGYDTAKLEYIDQSAID